MDKIILVPIIITILVIGVIGWALLSSDTEPTVSSEDISIESGSDISQEPQEEITEESIIEEDVEKESLEEESEDDTSEESEEDAEEETELEEDSEDEEITEEESSDEEYTEKTELEESEESYEEEEESDEEDMITGNVVKAQSKKPTLKKIIGPLLEIEYNVPERYQRLLPLTAKITSGKQIIYLEGTAERVKIVDNIEEPDIEIRGTLKDLEKLSKIKNINSLKKALGETKVQVKSNTFKGATVITAIEEITETKLVERSFIQKIIGTGISAATGKFTYGITSITGNFVLNNLN